MAPVLSVEGVGKCFVHRGTERVRTFHQFLEGGWRRLSPERSFWALRDLNFQVQRGETLGIVGHNGAGKSTLLRLLGGVMRPDEGRVIARAPVHGLLDLNAGMHPDLTGRENAIIGGIMAGFTRREILARLPEIIAFAELEEFINEPVRTYSSGMRMRLGFSVAIHIDPEILLIDEVLSVGDIAFQQKCLERITGFKERGCAIVFISHDLAQVEAMCDRVLWLSHGRVETLDRSGAVIAQYESSILEKAATLTPVNTPGERSLPNLKLQVNRFGTLESEICDVQLLDEQGNKITILNPGGGIIIHLRVRAAIPLTAMHIAIIISNDNGIDIMDANTQEDLVTLPQESGVFHLTITIDRLDLVPGRYNVSVGLYEKDWGFAFDQHVKAYQFTIEGSYCEGLIDPPRQWSIAN